MAWLRLAALVGLWLLSAGHPLLSALLPVLPHPRHLPRGGNLEDAIRDAVADVGAFAVAADPVPGVAEAPHLRGWLLPVTQPGLQEAVLPGALLHTTLPCPAPLNGTAPPQHRGTPEDACEAARAVAANVGQAYHSASLRGPSGSVGGRAADSEGRCHLVRPLGGAAPRRLAAPLTCRPGTLLAMTSPIVIDFATPRAESGGSVAVALRPASGDGHLLNAPPGGVLVLDCDRLADGVGLTVEVVADAPHAGTGLALAWCSRSVPLVGNNDGAGVARHRRLATSAYTGFCNRDVPGVTMWMNGFTLVGDPGNPCVALLFPQWLLSDVGAFAGACFGVFAVSVLVEGLVRLRRSVQRRRPRTKNGWAGYGHGALMVVLYGVNVTLSYFVMLVAMIYQVELFLMVVFGLAVGHALFHLSWTLPSFIAMEADPAPEVFTCCGGPQPCCGGPLPLGHSVEDNATPCCSPVEPVTETPSVSSSESSEENRVTTIRVSATDA
eukprot:EG_transcript_8365